MINTHPLMGTANYIKNNSLVSDYELFVYPQYILLKHGPNSYDRAEFTDKYVDKLLKIFLFRCWEFSEYDEKYRKLLGTWVKESHKHAKLE